MKCRNILYGYAIRNGCVVPDEQGSAVVKELFERYLSGQSLLRLSDYLNQQSIEYMPGVSGWNKARTKRLLEDRRYAGADGYPAIIDEFTYEAVQKLKTSRNLQVDTDRRSEIYQLNVPVRCPACGAFMKRRNYGQDKTQQRWICCSEDCKIRIKKSDESLLSDLTEMMNLVISDPSRIIIRTERTSSGASYRKTENEIGHMLDAPGFDKDQLRQKLLERFSLAYQEIDPDPYIDEKMKADFEKSDPLSFFTTDLFNRTVSEILLHIDGSVAITLINDQVIQKEATA